MRKIQKENMGHVSGGLLSLLSTNLWPSPSSERATFWFSFFLKLFSVKKREREKDKTDVASADPSRQAETQLLSVLELWGCDSCALPSAGFVISLESWRELPPYSEGTSTQSRGISSPRAPYWAAADPQWREGSEACVLANLALTRRG